MSRVTSWWRTPSGAGVRPFDAHAAHLTPEEPSGHAIANGEQEIEMPLNQQWNGRFSADPSTDGAAVIARVFSERHLGPTEARQSKGKISRLHWGRLTKCPGGSRERGTF